MFVFLTWIVIATYVLYYILLPFIKPLQLVSNRFSRKIHLYHLRYSGRLKWKQYKIIAQYKPPKWINSAEAWLLVHRFCSSTDMFSLLYKRKAESIIDIEVNKHWNGKESVMIKKLNKVKSSSPLYEQAFFNNLFWVKDSIKLSRFSDISSSCNLESLEKYWIDEGRFLDPKDSKIKNRFNNLIIFVWWALLVLLLYFIATFIFQSFFFHYSRIEDIFPILWFAIFVIWVWIVYKMPIKLKRTTEWEKLLAHILWYKLFIEKCDKKQIEELEKMDPLYFSEIVSYAVVFWLETKLLKNIVPMIDANINPMDGYYWKWENLSNFSDII